MGLKTTLIYSEPLLKRVALSFWWRVIGIKFLIAIGLTAAGLVVGYRAGDSSWLVGVAATTIFFAVAFMVVLYFMHYRNSMRKFKAMGEPHAEFVLTEDSFTLTSGAGSATLPWSSITELWKFQEYWLIFFSKSTFSTLPTTNLSPEIQRFLSERIEKAGGKITSQ